MNTFPCTQVAYRFASSTHLQQNRILQLEIPNPETMEDIGAVVSLLSKPGDVILLDGDLGAGKTCFCRGFIRSFTGISDLRVTSPTYLLCNTYLSHDGMVSVHHMDLYRLSGQNNDVDPLNLQHVFTNCISLIEWPSRLGSITPTHRLDIHFTINMSPSDRAVPNPDGDECITRYLVFEPHGEEWENRIRNIQEEGIIDDLIVS